MLVRRPRQEESRHVFPGVIAVITGENRVELRHYRHVLALVERANFRRSDHGVSQESPLT